MSGSRLWVHCPGQVSAAGTGVAALVEALNDPRWQPEVGLARPDAPPVPVATCRSFTTQGLLPPLIARRLDRPSRLLTVAARESLTAARECAGLTPSRTGVSAATGNAGTEALVQVLRAVFLEGPEAAPPMQFPSTVANAPASQLAILEKLSGPNLTFAEKQVGGLRAIIEACRIVERGRADHMLAAAADEAQWLNAECYLRARAAAAPGRAGFVVGEGAGVLMVDPGGGPDAVPIAGWGAAATPTTTYLYPREPSALVAATRVALQRAAWAPDDVDLVMSLANGAPVLDRLEVGALTAVFGARRPAILAITHRLGEGSFAALLRALVGVLTITGTVLPTWPLPAHLADAGFRQLDRRPRTVLVTGVAGGGSALAVALGST